MLRTHYSDVGKQDGSSNDAKGDEGARFGYSLFNLGWRDGTESEIANLIDIDGAEHSITVHWEEAAEKSEGLLGKDAQASDDRDAAREYFGAGLGNESDKHSFGHEKIEFELEKAGFDEETEIPYIYFGNWLRDHSQVITPMTKKIATRATLTKAVHYLSIIKHGTSGDFDVNPELLGEYEYDEHVDHPYGNPGANPASYAIDPKSWLPFVHSLIWAAVVGCNGRRLHVRAIFSRHSIREDKNRISSFRSRAARFRGLLCAFEFLRACAAFSERSNGSKIVPKRSCMDHAERGSGDPSGRDRGFRTGGYGGESHRSSR